MSGSDTALAAALAIVEDFGAHRRDAYFARFAPDATFVFHTHPVRLESRAEYEAVWDGWERDAGFRVHRCASTGRRIQDAGETAVFTHDVETELTLDGERQTVRERETIVLQRRDGRWLGIHEHLSAAS